MLWVYTDKTASTSKASAITVYFGYVVLLSFHLKFRFYHIDNGHRFISLRPVSATHIKDNADEKERHGNDLFVAKPHEGPLQTWLSASMHKDANKVELVAGHSDMQIISSISSGSNSRTFSVCICVKNINLSSDNNSFVLQNSRKKTFV